jgi:hypothetical protein
MRARVHRWDLDANAVVSIAVNEILNLCEVIAGELALLYLHAD